MNKVQGLVWETRKNIDIDLILLKSKKQSGVVIESNQTSTHFPAKTNKTMFTLVWSSLSFLYIHSLISNDLAQKSIVLPPKKKTHTHTHTNKKPKNKKKACIAAALESAPPP